MSYKIGNNIPVIPELEGREEVVMPVIIGQFDNPIFSGLTRISKCLVSDHNSSCQEVWEFVKMISKMSRPEIHSCFGVPTTEIFDLTYEEAKRRYDAWIKEETIK